MPSRRLLSRIRPAVSSESPQPNDPTLGGLTDSAPQAAYPDCTNENASPGWVAAVAVRLIRGDLPKLPGPVAGPLGQLLDVVSGILDAVEAMREEDECKHLIFRALKFLQSLVDHLRGSNVPIAEGAPIHAAAFALNMCLMEIRDDAHWWSQLITTVTLDKIKIVISRNPMDAFCFVMTLRVLMSSINTISDSAAALQPSSDLFFLSQSWYPIYPWREKVLKSKDTARSYALIEARLYKNEHNAEHEFVIAEFRGNAGVIFAAAERVTTLKDSDHNMSDEECDRTLKELKAEDERKRQKEREEQKRKEKQQTSKTTNFRKTLSFPMKPAPESSLLLSFSASLAERAMSVDDRIRLILGVQDFNAAVETVTKERSTKTTFTSRGSLKYQFGTQPNAASPSVSGDVLSAPLRPNFLNFTAAVHAIHRSRPYYTVGHNNCYWFAMGLMFVLNKNFTPSEPIIFDTKQGTWSLGVLTIPAGGLQKEEETELLEAYTRDMQEMELETLPLKTEQEIIDEQARHELEQQLNVHRQLVLKAKDRLSQTEKKVADAKILHGQANLKVSEAKAKVEKLAREADLVAKEEEFERQRLSFEATLEAVRSEHVKERSEQERRLQQMEARLEALASANVVLHL